MSEEVTHEEKETKANKLVAIVDAATPEDLQELRDAITAAELRLRGLRKLEVAVAEALGVPPSVSSFFLEPVAKRGPGRPKLDTTAFTAPPPANAVVSQAHVVAIKPEDIVIVDDDDDEDDEDEPASKRIGEFAARAATAATSPGSPADMRDAQIAVLNVLKGGGKTWHELLSACRRGPSALSKALKYPWFAKNGDKFVLSEAGKAAAA